MNRLIFKKFIISLLIISFSFAAMLSITALIANNNKKASTPIPSVNSATVSNWDAQEIHLKDVGDLKNFRDKVNSGKTFKGQTIYLDNDIDLSKDTNSKDNWIPIGFSYDNRTSATWVTHKNRFSYSNTSIYFSGTFNGQNHTISGLTINETYYTYTGTPRAEQNDETYNKFPFNNPDQNAWKSYYHMYSGLFGYLYNASVSNLFIDSPTITLNGQKIRDQNRQDTYIYYNQGDVGVFAGRMAYKSSLSRCMITGTAKIQVASDLPSRIGKVSTDIFAHYTNGIGGFVGVMDKTCIIERSIIESIHFDVDSYINRAAAYTDAEYEYLAVGGMVGLLTEAFTYTGYTSDIKSVNIDYTYIKSIDGECRSHDMENYHYDLTDNNVYVWNNDNIFGSYYGNIVGLVKRLESNYDLNFISHGGAPDVKVTMPKDGNAQFESQSNLFGGGYTFEIVKGHLSDSKWEFTKDDPVDCANTISWFGGECAKGITKAFSLYADYSSGQRMGVPYQYVFVMDTNNQIFGGWPILTEFLQLKELQIEVNDKDGLMQPYEVDLGNDVKRVLNVTTNHSGTTSISSSAQYGDTGLFVPSIYNGSINVSHPDADQTNTLSISLNFNLTKFGSNYSQSLQLMLNDNYEYQSATMEGNVVKINIQVKAFEVTLEDAIYNLGNDPRGNHEFSKSVLTCPTKVLKVEKSNTSVTLKANVDSRTIEIAGQKYTYDWQAGTFTDDDGYFDIIWQYKEAGQENWEPAWGTNNNFNKTNINKTITSDISIRPLLNLRRYNVDLTSQKDYNGSTIRKWYQGEHNSLNETNISKITNVAVGSRISYSVGSDYVTLEIREDPDYKFSNCGIQGLNYVTAKYHLHKDPRLGDAQGYGFLNLTFNGEMFDSGQINGKLLAKNEVATDGASTVEAVFAPIEYSIPLYYSIELTDTVGETYSKYLDVHFNIVNGIDITGIKPNESYVNNPELSFGSWIFNLNNAEKIGNVSPKYTNIDDYQRTTITFTRSNCVLKIMIGDRLTMLDENKYIFEVTGLAPGSYGDMPKISSTAPLPLIYAKWSKTYNVSVENKDSNNLHYVEDADENIYYGVFVDSTDEEKLSKVDAYTINMKIKQNPDYTYSFVSSEINGQGLSFYTLNNFKTAIDSYLSVGGNGRWTVFNYGYRITGWRIYFEIGNNTYYLTYDSTNRWGNSEANPITPVTIDINMLRGDTNMALMSNYAEFLDGVLADSSIAPLIRMVPVWQPVSVAVKANRTSGLTSEQIDLNNNIVYNSPYTLNNVARFNLVGQSVVYFYNGETQKGKTQIVVIPETNFNGVISWNYRNFEHGDFASFDSSSHVYTLSNLTPRYANSIYKINLNGVDSFVLDDKYSNYSFNENAGGFGEDVYAFNNVEFGYKSYSADEYPFVQDYASWLNNYVNQFDNYLTAGAGQIEGNTLTILDPVVYYSGTTKLNDYTLNSAPSSLYIYLANGTSVGNSLPVFNRDYYTLIYWENVYNDTNIYLTEALDGLNLENPESTYDDKMVLTYWNLTDGHAGNKAALNTHYYRKFYYLNTSTVFGEYDELGRYGYLTISATDTIDNGAKDVKYLVIYDLDSNNMSYYTFTSGSSLTNFNLTPYEEDQLLFYAGCDLSFDIYDQSRDVDAVENGDNDSFIGYRFKELNALDFVNLSLQNSNLNSYSISLPASSIESANFKNGYADGQIVAKFEKIVYSVNLLIDQAAGSLNVSHNGVELANVSEISNMTIDDEYVISYRSELGYELTSTNPLTFTNSINNNIIVVLYSTAEEDGVIIQRYVLTLNAEWLRTNYYSNFDNAYSVNNTNLGNINVNTQEILFNYGVKVYDISDNDENINIRTLLENRADYGNYSLSNNTVDISNLFVEIGGGWGYKYNGVEYAVMQSGEYNVTNPTIRLNSCIFFKEYDYLLSSSIKPNVSYSVSPDQLKNLIEYEDGVIVPKDARNIYFVVYVRQQFAITLKVEFMDKDAKSGTRTTTFSMQTRNNNATLTISGADENKSIIVYTYAGYTANILNYSLDADAQKRYSGVEYTLNENINILPNTNFQITENSTIVIKYIPKSLNVITQFYVNNVLCDEQPSEITEFAITSSSSSLNLFVNDVLTVSYQCNPDYDISITFNNKTPQSTQNNTVAYTITDDDYEAGFVNLVVMLTIHKNGDLQIAFSLEDGKALSSDDYGRFEVTVSGNEQTSTTQGTKSVSINVLEGRAISLKIHLNEGYSFKYIKDDRNQLITDVLQDEIVLTDNFDVTVKSYIICIKKDSIQVNLQFDEGQIANYTLDVNDENGIQKTVDETGNVSITGLYVGKEVSIRRLSDLPYEELEYYYLQGFESNHISSPLAIDKELLRTLQSNTITIKVKSIRKYYISIEYDNPELTDLKLSSDIGETGNYIAEDADHTASLTFTLDSTVPTKYITSVYLQNASQALKSGFNPITFTLSVNKGNISIDDEFKATVIDSQFVNIKISVEARTFNQTDSVREYLYDALEQEPQLTDTPVNNAQNLGKTGYLEQAELCIVRKTDDRELTEFNIQTVEGATINVKLDGNLQATSSAGKVEINGNVITLTIGDGDDAVTYTYTLIVQENRIYIYYTVYGPTQIELYYTAFKTVQPS